MNSSHHSTVIRTVINRCERRWRTPAARSRSPVDVVDVRWWRRAGDQLGHPEVDTGEHQERGQRDQEAGDLGLHHQVAVEEPDGQRDDQRQRRPRPTCSGAGGRTACAAASAAVITATPADRSNSPPIISSATADRDDPDRRAGVQHGGERRQRAERRGDDEEEDEDRDRARRRAPISGRVEQARERSDRFTGSVPQALCGRWGWRRRRRRRELMAGSRLSGQDGRRTAPGSTPAMRSRSNRRPAGGSHVGSRRGD